MENLLRDESVRSASADDFRVNPTEPDREIPEWESVGYTYDGKQCDPDYQLCCAKAIKDNESGNTKYYVKYAMNGPNAGSLLNRNSPLFTVGDDTRKQTSAGRNRYEFKKVNEEAYLSYLRYLKSGNEAHLRIAQRLLD